ncbi:MAG: hypothetical protein KTR26_10105 [Flammeovirgaceae bacterium]|nr:hypothetical protein [Flammeovirgaceae bacterium]
MNTKNKLPFFIGWLLLFTFSCQQKPANNPEIKQETLKVIPPNIIWIVAEDYESKNQMLWR